MTRKTIARQVDGTLGRKVDDALNELKAGAAKGSPGTDYRSRSLAIHGLVCARCGREFTTKNVRLLTVHHKDNDPRNNPPDGSNWENLCVYCHDAEHSRELLGDYENGTGTSSEETGDDRPPLGTLGDLLKNKLAGR